MLVTLRQKEKENQIADDPEEIFSTEQNALIPWRYDAFIYIDETKALHALRMKEHQHEPPELFPWNY